MADPEIRAGGRGTKRESGDCAPSGCAGGKVPAEGLGAKSPISCGINAFCVMSQAFSYEYRNIKIIFRSLGLFPLSLRSKIFFSGPLGGGDGDRPTAPSAPHGSAAVSYSRRWRRQADRTAAATK